MMMLIIALFKERPNEAIETKTLAGKIYTATKLNIPKAKGI